MNGTKVDQRQEIYAFAHCQTWLEIYANTIGVPASALTRRVGEILFSTSGGPLVGFEGGMPALPTEAAGRGDLRSPKMAMARGPYNKRSQKRKEKRVMQRVHCPQCNEMFPLNTMHKHLMHTHGWSREQFNVWTNSRRAPKPIAAAV
jgi:hypothetical protein